MKDLFKEMDKIRDEYSNIFPIFDFENSFLELKKEFDKNKKDRILLFQTFHYDLNELKKEAHKEMKKSVYLFNQIDNCSWKIFDLFFKKADY